MPTGQNTDVEAKAPQALPRGDSLLSFDLVLFAANDVERNGIPKCMEQALQVQPFRIALVMIDEICRVMQDESPFSVTAARGVRTRSISKTAVSM